MGDAVPSHTVGQWNDDVLGHDFEATELTLPPDAEGEACATLVRHRRPRWSPRHWSPRHWSPLQWSPRHWSRLQWSPRHWSRLQWSPRHWSRLQWSPLQWSPRHWSRLQWSPRHWSRLQWSRRRPSFDVLYVHGWSDYFFQRELAEFWTERGATFYALDLRKYGRSLRPHQTPGYIDDLETYDEDIAAALAVMRVHARRPLVLMGHSTGGLTLSLWAARHPGEAVGLVLNSPWLEFQMGPAARALLEPMVELGRRLLPLGQYPQFDHGFYSRSISTRFEGEWDVDASWKPDLGFRANRGWLSAIFHGQARVGEGLGLPMPVLVMLSQRSLLQAAWTPEMAHADVVIDVDAAAHKAADLGSDVTIRRFDGALHDVVLSKKPVRNAVWDAIEDWLPRVV